MLLRLRSPDGMFRQTVDKDDTFGDLISQVLASPAPPRVASANSSAQLVPQLPKTIDPQTITLSNHPSGGDAKKIGDIARFKISQVGLGQGPSLSLLMHGS